VEEEDAADAWGFRRIVGHEEDATGEMTWLVEWGTLLDGDGTMTWDDSWEPTSSLEGTGLREVHSYVRRARLEDALIAEVRALACGLIVVCRTTYRS
jgi:hypothetical protein